VGSVFVVAWVAAIASTIVLNHRSRTGPRRELPPYTGAVAGASAERLVVDGLEVDLYRGTVVTIVVRTPAIPLRVGLVGTFRLRVAGAPVALVDRLRPRLRAFTQRRSVVSLSFADNQLTLRVYADDTTAEVADVVALARDLLAVVSALEEEAVTDTETLYRDDPRAQIRARWQAELDAAR
jgi:hypothetical protein